MIRQKDPLSVRRQCELLDVCRSGLYRSGSPAPVERLDAMNEIDRMHTDHPFMGSRQISTQLQRAGRKIHRSRVQRLMRTMGIYGVVPGPHTSKKHPQHEVYPYLLRNVSIERPNQVWSSDITYIPFRKGFFYLVAITDWYSRKVLSWRLSTTLDERFCLDALDEAFRRYGQPEIFNSDQGSHYTAKKWIQRLKDSHINISMDGKGRALDNVIVERFWRTVKYEWIYLNPAGTALSSRRESHNTSTGTTSNAGIHRSTDARPTSDIRRDYRQLTRRDRPNCEHSAPLI